MPGRIDRLISESRMTSTPSDLLAEVHVYILPQDKWIPFRRLAQNTVTEETVSAGFVRVLPDVTLVDLRQELISQLGVDVPDHYVFIKCVGRNFTQVKPRQEQMVKVKNFLPPHAHEPEIHIMEISEELLRYAPSLSNLLVSDTELSDSQPQSRLTQHETYGRSENLPTWAETGEGKWDELREHRTWEGHLNDHSHYYDASGAAVGGAVSGASSIMAGIFNREHYDVESGIMTQWITDRYQGEGDMNGRREDEGRHSGARDRGDGMSDGKERRSEEKDDGAIEASAESSEDQMERVKERSRKNEGKTTRSDARSRRDETRKSESKHGKDDKGKNVKSNGKGENSETRTKHEASLIERDYKENMEVHGELLNQTEVDERNGKDIEGNRDGKSEEDGNYSDKRSSEGKKSLRLKNQTKKSQEKHKNRMRREAMIKKGNRSEDESNSDSQLTAVSTREILAERIEGVGLRRIDKNDHENIVEESEKDTLNEMNEADMKTMKVESNEKLIQRIGDIEVMQHETQNQEKNVDEWSNADERDYFISQRDEGDGKLDEESNFGNTWTKGDPTTDGGIKTQENDSKLSEGDQKIHSEEGDERHKNSSEGHDLRTDTGETNDSSVGRNIYAKTENGEMVTIRDTESADTTDAMTRNRDERAVDTDAMARNRVLIDSHEGRYLESLLDDDRKEEMLRLNEETEESQNTRDSNKNNDSSQKDRTKAKETATADNKERGRRETSTTDKKDRVRTADEEGDGGGDQNGVGMGGAKGPGRARQRRRTKKGLVSDGEGDDEQLRGSLQRRVSINTRFESGRKLTRSASESRISELGSDGEEGIEGRREAKGSPKVKRSASEERLGYDPWLYAPHKWYYARIERPPTGEEDKGIPTTGETEEDRKARLKALEAQKQTSLDGETANNQFPRPNVEILSMDGSLRGPLASLQEGVVSGFQVNSSDVDSSSENPPGSRPDHLTLTYEIEVDEERGRIRKIGKIPEGVGRGAWESEVEDGSTDFAETGDTTGVTDDSDGAQRRKKGPAKHTRKGSLDQYTKASPRMSLKYVSLGRGSAKVLPPLSDSATEEVVLFRGLDNRALFTNSAAILPSNHDIMEDKMSGKLAQVLKEKAEAETRRQKLFTQAKNLHDEILRIKEKRREQWWKQYQESRKIGSQMEERQMTHRNELDALHRKIIGSIIRRQPLVTGVRDEPSRKANYKISIIRLRHEVEDLRRRVEAMDIKVETEVRLRSQAEREVKTLRQEVSRKKANMAISQSKVSSLRSAGYLPPDLLVRM